MKWLDNFFEKKTRTLAQQASRRSALVKVGKLFVGAAFVLPVLPFDRIGQSAQAFEKGKGHASSDDDTSCDYWRYCALDGFLCTCCGGTISSCPPGTEVSKVTWVGTCHNPADGKDYLIDQGRSMARRLAQPIDDLLHVCHVIGDGMPVDVFVPVTAAVAPQGDGVAGETGGGKLRQEGIGPHPGSGESAMDEEQGSGAGGSCR